MPKLLEVMEETDTKIHCQATMSDMHPCSATDYPKVGNQAKPLKYSGGGLYFLPISRCPNMQLPTSYKADNNAADTDVCTQICLMGLPLPQGYRQ